MIQYCIRCLMQFDNYDVLYNIKPIADGMLTYDNFYNDLITGRFVWKI